MVTSAKSLNRDAGLLENGFRVLQAALNTYDGFGASMPKETLLAQRMYLRMIKTKLERIDARLRQ